MPSDLIYKMDADTAKAVQDVVSFTKKIEGLVKSLDGVERSGGRAGRGLDFAGKGTSDLIKMAGGVLSVKTGIDAATGALRAFEEMAQRSGTAVNSLIEKSTGLMMVSDNPRIMAESTMHGARYGVSAADSTEIWARALSRMQGDEQKARVMANQMMLLNQFGAKTEDSETAILSGTARGLTPQQTTDLTAFHAQASDLEVSDIARVMPQAGGFSSLDIGLAAASAASRSAPRDQLPTVVSNISKGLRQDSPLTLQVAKMYGKNSAAEVSEPQMALGIKQVMGADAADWTQYKRYGIEAKETGQALGWLEQNADFFAQQAAAQKPAGYARDLMLSKQAQFPELQRQQQTAEMRAAAAARRMTGRRAYESQQMALENQQAGLQMEEAGLGGLTTDEGIPWYGMRRSMRALSRASEQFQEGHYLQAAGSIYGEVEKWKHPAASLAQYAVKESINAKLDSQDVKAITDRLDKLTEATKEQTRTFRNQRPSTRPDRGQALMGGE